MPRSKLYPAKKSIGFDVEMLSAIEAWRAKQKPIPSCPKRSDGWLGRALSIRRRPDGKMPLPHRRHQSWQEWKSTV